MAQVTVEQLAETVGASVDRLLSQMKDAGLPYAAADEAVLRKTSRHCSRILSRVTVSARVHQGKLL